MDITQLSEQELMLYSLQVSKKYLSFLRTSRVIYWFLSLVGILVCIIQLILCYFGWNTPIFFTIQGILLMFNSYNVYQSVIEIPEVTAKIISVKKEIERLNALTEQGQNQAKKENKA